MDRHGKKAKAKPAATHGERSDMKAKSRGVLDQINLSARSGTGAQGAKAPAAPARTEPGSRS